MPKTPAPDDLIGSAVACDLLNIDRSTLSRWVSAGKLAPALRLPGATGAFLFKREDVEALRQGSAA
ncbi:MAG: helix-turn-helix domain-containing protein [Actinomycetota bacterium]|nr:helix-turn-helix domain-containing protein [Actinomycetota bacterium]